jgi:hypothetical protein
METISVNIQGKSRKFNVLPETSACKGCVANKNITLCTQLNRFGCSDDQIIYVETSNKQTFTLEQIETAWKDTWGDAPGAEFIKVLTKVADPEYNEYKRLQSKFEV